MAFKSFGEEVFGLNDKQRSDVAEAVVQDDYARNTEDIYEERAIARDKRRVNFSEYQVGRATKRKYKKTYERENDVNFEDGTGDHQDFNERKNKYYTDVHVDRIRVQAEQEQMTDKQKSRLKGNFQQLVDNRSGGGASATAEGRRALPNETLQAFLDRMQGGGDGKQQEVKDQSVNGKRERDANDYDWVLSDTRNRREFESSRAAATAANAGDESSSKRKAVLESNDEYIVTKVTIQTTDNEWFDKHRRSEGSAGAESQKSESEVPIQISRKEVRHMQALTKRLYGREITEQDYVESVKKKLIGETDGGKKKDDKKGEEAFVEQQMDEWEMENYDPAQDEMGGDQVDSYSNNWQQAIDAQSRKNMAPEVDWQKTVYGRSTSDQCKRFESLMFVTNQKSIDQLVDDAGIHTQLECQMRKLRFCLTAEQLVFNSIKDWAKHIDSCDVVFSKSKFYRARIETKTKGYRGLSNLNKSNTKVDEEHRMVLYHDMKNGFFVCNHFRVEKKDEKERKEEQKRIFDDDYLTNKDDKTSQKNYKFIWIGHVYLQYVNTYN